MDEIFLFVFLVSLLSGASFAENKINFLGKWAFNDLTPKTAKCFEITKSYIKLKRALINNCKQSRGGGYAQDKSENPQSCAANKEGILITNSQVGCQKQLEAELANGD